MRRILHTVLCIGVLAALAGCAKEALAPAAENSRVIKWNVSTNSPATKVYPAGSTEYSTSNSFGSYALLYTGSSASDWATASYTSYINGLQIRYFGVGTPMWSTMTEYYWPTAANARLHFASFSPYRTLHNKAIYGSKTDGITINDYIVPADKEDQHFLTVQGEDPIYDDDIMVSNEYDVDCEAMQSADLGPTYAFTGVPTKFTHVLTRINIRFIHNTDFHVNYYDEQTISIRGVTFKNIYTEGAFKSNPDANGDPRPAWSNHSSQAASAVLYKSNIGTAAIQQGTSAEVAGGTVTPTTVVSGYLALPQTISSGVQQVEVSYRIISKVSGYLFTEDVEETAYLSLANQNWLPNTDLTYTITLFAIREQPIRFTASCEPWIDCAPGGVETPGQNFHITEED